MAVSSFFLLSSIGTILSVFLIFINTIAIFFFSHLVFAHFHSGKIIREFFDALRGI